jgi:hypothetical protein
MSKSRISEFARQSRVVKRVERPYAGYYRHAGVPLDDKRSRASAAARRGANTCAAAGSWYSFPASSVSGR